MAEQSKHDDAAMQTPPNGLAGERAKFEKERMNRRAALRRFGIGAGATAFLALGVDDLARLVLTKMQERHIMDGVTEQVAHELHNAGVSFATDPVTCSHCNRQYCADLSADFDAFLACSARGGTYQQCQAESDARHNDLNYDFNQCKAAHCPANHPTPDCRPIGSDT